MEKTNPFRLKKSRVVLLISCCFILAGPANLANALFQGHVGDWYLPSLWFELFTKLPWSQRAIIALLPAAGVGLLVQRRVSWFFALIILCGLCAQNLYYFFSNSSVIYPWYVPLLFNSSVLVVFYYFRFPYLDRRDRIFGGRSLRHNVDLRVAVEGFAKEVTLNNLSDTGCFLLFDSAQTLPPLNEKIRFNLDGDWIQGEVMRHQSPGCGIGFKKPRKLSRKSMRKILSKFAR